MPSTAFQRMSCFPEPQKGSTKWTPPQTKTDPIITFERIGDYGESSFGSFSGSGFLTSHIKLMKLLAAKYAPTASSRSFMGGSTPNKGLLCNSHHNSRCEKLWWLVKKGRSKYRLGSDTESVEILSQILESHELGRKLNNEHEWRDRT